MVSVLAKRTYRNLFLAQVIALLGTGLATVALGLLAYDIAGADGGAVLGTAMAIKMVAYIAVAPIVGAYAARLPRRAFLIAMDVVRAVAVLALPFVDAVWQVYLLIFVLQSASAGFTPTFQATIPDVLPDEKDYTQALSLSRLAYDLEALVSPVLAAVLLTVMSFHWLFSGTAIGFAVSAALVLATALPQARASAPVGGAWPQITRGARFYLGTPRLRGLLATTLAAAAASAMVIVNTAVLVRSGLGFGQREVAVTLGAYGAGSMLAAVLLPRALANTPERRVMIGGAIVLTIALAALALSWPLRTLPVYWFGLLGGWSLLGAAYAASITPAGRLLRRSSRAEDRPALFAAQFALSHVCWLIAYPLAGHVGAQAGMGAAFAAAAVLALIGVVLAATLWPRDDPQIVDHRHHLPADHPHVREDHLEGRASHVFVLDDLHQHWPR